MGLSVGELTAYLDLNDTAFNAKLSRAQGRMQTVGKAMTKAAVAGAVVAGVVVAKSIKTYNDWGTAIATITRLTGMSTQAASQFAGQWKRFGIDAQSGIVATRFLAKNLDAAQQGGKAMADTFKRLGIHLRDAHGKLRQVGDVLPEVRDKLSQMDNAGQRTALTLKLFGRGGAEMLKWLNKSPAEIAKVNKELAGLGMVWGGKQIRDWAALKDAQHEMSLQWTALQLNLAQTLLPQLQKLMGFVTGLTQKWNALSDGTQGTVLKIMALVGVLGLIVPKALAAAAAIRTLTAASAAGGAVSAASGAESTVAAAVARAAVSRGPGMLVTPAVASGGAASTAATAGAVGAGTIAAIVGSLVAAGALALIADHVVGKWATQNPDAATYKAQVNNKVYGTPVVAGRTGVGNISGSTGARQTSHAQTLDKVILDLEMRGGGNKALNDAMTAIQLLRSDAAKSIDFTIDPAQPLNSLKSIAARLQGLGMDGKTAVRVLTTMFGKDIVGPFRKQLMGMPPAMDKAAAATERRFQTMRQKLQQRIAMSAPDNSALLAKISEVIARMGALSYAGERAQQAVNRALQGAGSGAAHAPTGTGSATGGITTGPLSGYRALLHGTEAVIPLNGMPYTPGRVVDYTAGGRRRGAVRSSSGGDITVQVAVNAPIYGVDDLHEVIHSATMAAMEEAQVADWRSMRGSVR